MTDDLEPTTDSEATEEEPGDPIDPQPTDPDPAPDPDPVPDTPSGDTLVWEPYTWYSITYACLTAGCPNQNIVRSAPMFYTNDGQTKNIRVVDASSDACGKDCKILTAAKLNPQPVEE